MIPDLGLDLSWHERANCRGVNPRLFFPEKDDNATRLHAKQVCKPCEVRAECLAYAIEAMEPFGVWGGAGPTERRDMRLGRRVGLTKTAARPRIRRTGHDTAGRNGQKESVTGGNRVARSAVVDSRWRWTHQVVRRGVEGTPWHLGALPNSP